MENWKLNWTKLTPLKEASNLPDGIAGVYRLSYKDDDGNYYVFYVGQAEDIKSRLLQHSPEEEDNVCIETYLNSKECFFRYAKITQKHVRDAIERQAYRHYEPRCNEREPSGEDNIKGNLT